MTNALLIISISLITLYQLLFKKNVERVNWKEITFICLFYSAVVFLFLYFTGVLGSGYHYVDDHEVYTINYDVSRYGIFGAIYETIRKDMTGMHRYRFTYFLIRVVQSVIFKDHMFAWHCMYGVITVFNLTAGYYYARRRGYPIVLSFLFFLIVFVGCDQTAVVWRLGPQENLGLSILILTLIFNRRYYETKGRKWLILSCLTTFFLSGAKEAFLLLLPTIPLVFLLWDMEREKLSRKMIVRCWKEYRVYFVFTWIVFVIGALIIWKFTGMESGIEGKFTIGDYLSRFNEIYQTRLKKYIDLASIAALFGLFAIIIKKKNIAYYLIALLLAGGNLVLQCILHAKGLMLERYLIPSTFIVAIFSLLAIGHMVLQNKVLLTVFQVVIVIVCATMCVTETEEQARYYSNDGLNTTASVQMLSEIYDGGNVLTDLGYEQDYSAAILLQSKYNIPNVYNVGYNEQRADGRFPDSWHPETDEELSISLEEAKYLLLGEGSHLFSKVKTGEVHFDPYYFGEYCLLVRQ